MHFSPSLLTRILLQPALAGPIRLSLARHFRLGSEEWRLLDEFELPGSLPATRDPVLRAFRRLVRRDFGELRAMHRVAAETAAIRPFGLFYLVLEEAAQMEHSGELPALADDPAFRIYFELPPPAEETFQHTEALFDLRARGIAEVVRRQIAIGDSSFPSFMSFAYSLASQGEGDRELEAFFAETVAQALEMNHQPLEAARQQHTAFSLLLEHPAPDRAAEALADLGELLVREQLDSATAELVFEKAEARLAALPLHLNLPLRRRLDSVRRIH